MVARFDELPLNRADRHSVLPVRITRVQSRLQRAVTTAGLGGFYQLVGAASSNGTDDCLASLLQCESM